MTRPFFFRASISSNWTLYCTLRQEDKSLKNVSITNDTSQQPEFTSSSKNEVDAISVCSGRRSLGAAKTPKADDEALNLCGRVVNPSTFQDHEVGEQAPEGENVPLLRDCKAEDTL